MPRGAWQRNDASASNRKSQTGPSITLALGSGRGRLRARSGGTAAKFPPEESPATARRVGSPPISTACWPSQSQTASTSSSSVGIGRSGANRQSAQTTTASLFRHNRWIRKSVSRIYRGWVCDRARLAPRRGCHPRLRRRLTTIPAEGPRIRQFMPVERAGPGPLPCRPRTKGLLPSFTSPSAGRAELADTCHTVGGRKGLKTAPSGEPHGPTVAAINRAGTENPSPHTVEGGIPWEHEGTRRS